MFNSFKQKKQPHGTGTLVFKKKSFKRRNGATGEKIQATLMDAETGRSYSVSINLPLKFEADNKNAGQKIVFGNVACFLKD